MSTRVILHGATIRIETTTELRFASDDAARAAFEKIEAERRVVLDVDARGVTRLNAKVMR